MVGGALAHYKILERIGVGGMGEVFIADDSKLHRQVALKILPRELASGVFDAAASVYLDRFLNVPSIPIPAPSGTVKDAEARLNEFEDLLDRQQRVNDAAALVVDCLHAGIEPDRLLAVLGRALLREDRNFHTIQAVEAALRHHEFTRGTPAAPVVLVAAARYLAAHAPTARAQGQTYQIAQRLHRGERLHGDG
jgi:hypothetical protein